MTVSNDRLRHCIESSEFCGEIKSMAAELLELRAAAKPDCGRIQNWRRVDAYGGLGYVILGRFLDHHRLKGCENGHTSYVVKHDEKTGAVETRNSRYTLVGPESFKDAA